MQGYSKPEMSIEEFKEERDMINKMYSLGFMEEYTA